MMNDFHDDGFGLFSDDPQEQLFYYYAYTQMTGDDPFELFDDELPQDSYLPPRTNAPKGAFHSSSYRPDTQVHPHTQKYADYLQNRRKRSNTSVSDIIFVIGLIYFIALAAIGIIFFLTH